MKTGLNLVELAQRITDNANAKRDLIAPASSVQLRVRVADDGKNLQGHERIVMEVPNAGTSTFPMRSTAHDQVGSYVGVPSKYYDRMLTDAPELLASNVNTWLRRESTDKRMVRTIHGRARAFLSNRYQRIENEEIAEVALPILLNTPGLRVVSSEVTERRLYIQATTDRIVGDVKVGDAVQAGLVIRNSEIGYGAVSVQAMIYRLRCLNGMILPDNFRASHLGRRIDDNDALFRDDTRAADDKTVLLKVRDIVSGFLTREFFDRKLADMRGLTEQRITGDPARAVEVLAKKVGANEDERGGILRSLIEGGDLSRWGLLNAVTHQAHGAQDYDRSVEFEAMGGKLLELPANDWKEVLRAAA